MRLALLMPVRWHLRHHGVGHRIVGEYIVSQAMMMIVVLGHRRYVKHGYRLRFTRFTSLWRHMTMASRCFRLLRQSFSAPRRTHTGQHIEHRRHDGEMGMLECH